MELPEAIKIHPLVNVSQVKKYYGSLQAVSPNKVDGEEEFKVEGILDHRRSGRGYQYLVSWMGYDGYLSKSSADLPRDYTKCQKIACT